MKKILSILFSCTLLLGITSCNDFLNITPEGQVKRDQLLSTPAGIEDALYGVYSQMRQTILYGQEMSFSALEVMAQTMTCKGNSAIEALGEYKYTDTRVEGLFEEVWIQMYKNISNVNSILGCKLIRNATEYPFNLYRGEALGLRAYMHFDLVRLFAEQITGNPSADGIPYATEFSLKNPDFESLKDNYVHIINDLLEAESLLAHEKDYVNTTPFMRDRQIHFNIDAVRALLARVYLTQGDKVNAALYARKVIDDSDYRLCEKTEVEGNVAGVLSTKETIFGIYYREFFKDVKAKLQETTSFYSLNPRKDILSVYDRHAQGLDYRATAYFTTIDNGGTPTIRLSKLTDKYELQGMGGSRPKELIQGINLIRMPEMHYIAAEALLDSDPAEAKRLFDEVLIHRGLQPLSETGDTLTLDRICLERYKEYIGEGYSFFDSKRLNRNIERFDEASQTIKYVTARKEIFTLPIPKVEIANRW